MFNVVCPGLVGKVDQVSFLHERPARAKRHSSMDGCKHQSEAHLCAVAVSGRLLAAPLMLLA